MDSEVRPEHLRVAGSSRELQRGLGIRQRPGLVPEAHADERPDHSGDAIDVVALIFTRRKHLIDLLQSLVPVPEHVVVPGHVAEEPAALAWRAHALGLVGSFLVQRPAPLQIADVRCYGAQVDVRAQSLRRPGRADLEGALEIGEAFDLPDLDARRPERDQRAQANVLELEGLRHLQRLPPELARPHVLFSEHCETRQLCKRLGVAP